jgi:hypothetical protein
MTRPLFLLVLATAGCTTYLEAPEGLDGNQREQLGTIVITEVMADPSACTDEAAEWIEVENRTGEDIDLTGYVLVDAAGNEAKIVADKPLWAGEVMQIGRGSWDSFCVGETHPYAYWDGTLGLNDDAESLALYAPDGTLLDQTPTLDRFEKGMSLSLDPEAFDGDDPAAWYLGHDCINTFGTSPGVPNPTCHEELSWFGVDHPGAELPADFDPLPWLRDAHGLAQGILDRELDVDADGVYFHYLRLDNEPAVDPEDFVPGDAHWTITFVTYGENDLWTRKNLFVTLDINDGTYWLEEDFASDSLKKVRIEDLDAVTMSAQDLMDELDDDWGWWDDVGFATLSWASYDSTPSWIGVDDDNDDRQVYDAVTWEERRR